MKADTPVNPYDSGTEGSEPTNPYPACNSTEEKEPRPPSPATTDGNGPLICGMVESQCPRVQDSEGPAAKLNGSGSVEGPKTEMGLSMEVDPSAQVTPEEESLKDGQCGALSGETPLLLMLCVLPTNFHPSLPLSRCLSCCVFSLSVEGCQESVVGGILLNHIAVQINQSVDIKQTLVGHNGFQRLNLFVLYSNWPFNVSFR